MKSSSAALIASHKWKLWLSGCILMAASACLFFPGPLGRFLDAEPVLVNFMGIALGIAALVVGLLLLRCPSCGLSLMWYALRKQSYTAWLGWLLDVRACPRCGATSSDHDA
jgi:hypothetical protein